MKQPIERDDRLYQFGPFCFDAGERVLLREGRLVPLPAKALSTLLVLISNSGHLVEKNMLMEELWPDDIVEEGNLAQHIFMLRRALGETTEDPKYIETVPRRGYRFVASVRGARLDTAELPHNGTEQANLRQDTSALAADIQSIAVLPFETIGGETHDEYLGLGIADALITKLSNLKRLTVRPTSAVRNAVKGDPVSAGSDLKVATVLEGSIQQRDEYIRVTVQLVSVRDGATLWAERFDEKSTSIFAIEDSISEQVARALAVKLTVEERTQLVKRYTENTRAHQAYLKGRYFLEKRTQEGLAKGIEYFELAIGVDPNYALAHAGLADCYGMLGIYDVIPPKECMPKVKETALKALSIDPNLAEAHSALGRARMIEWDWSGAEQSFKLAIDLNATSPTARTLYSLYLRLLRRFDESIAQGRKAEECDPTSAGRLSTIGGTLYCARRYDEAIEELRRALELDSGNGIAHFYLGRIYVQKHMYKEAIAEYERTNLFGKGQEVLAHLGYVYAVSGRKEAARKALAELEEISNRDYVPPYFKALVYAGLDEKEMAFECLESAHQEHDLNLSSLAIDPLMDNLRGDRRVTSLLQRTGLLPHLRDAPSSLLTPGISV
ncbi:MAG TPA: winged helix-turn-helix domain-containing protein [Pyrinomonadaceae bacterium]|nr:winged helix-turn-helix domain-containing protein [Pyrinomonadaceae bacterium]